MRSKFYAVAGAVLLMTANAAAADSAKDFANQVIDRNAETMAKVGDSIFYFAELGMQEFESTKLLKDVLEAGGFTVEVGGAGMPTNLWAKWGTGKPVIAIVTEVDALPEGSQTPGSIERKPMIAGAPGHMEGHNTHGGVATAAAFAVKQAMQRFNIPGTVVVSFGPAEEQLISRPFLVRAGYFKDADAAMMMHIGTAFAPQATVFRTMQPSARNSLSRQDRAWRGHPWDGKDAVDAVELMDLGFDKLREHLQPTYRATATITMGGIQPNMIPDKAKSGGMCATPRPVRQGKLSTNWSTSARAPR